MDGYRLWVNVGEQLGVGPYFFREPCVAWLTRTLIGRGDVCVDAGANAGVYTFLCASVVGHSGRVFAFEPNPEFAALLERSTQLNGFERIVQVDRRALYSKSGERRRFFVSVNPTNTGTSSLVNHGVFLSADRTVDVETVGFDDFAREVEVSHFRLVKVDVECAEEFVFAGATETLAERRIDFLIVEMRSESRSQELLEGAGYRGYLLVQERRALVPLSDVAAGHFGDFLFVRPGLDIPRV
jgi:FkbM family methyltransferase